jgi:tetratricopeptide (TPR) repeat protein
LGRVLGLSNRGERAEELLKSCLEGPFPKRGEKVRIDREIGETYWVLAFLAFSQGRSKEAQAYAQKAFVYLPDDPRGFLLLGNIQLAERRYHPARVYYRKALAKAAAAAQPEIHAGLAKAAMNLQEIPEAVAEWEKVLALRPNHEEANRVLGQLALRNGDAKAAEGYFRKHLKRRENDPGAHLLLGMALRQGGDYLKAQAEYEEAIRLAPQEPIAYFNLAVLFHKFLKDPPRALLTYERYAQLDPQAARSKEVSELMNDARREAAKPPAKPAVPGRKP